VSFLAARWSALECRGDCLCPLSQGRDRLFRTSHRSRLRGVHPLGWHAADRSEAGFGGLVLGHIDFSRSAAISLLSCEQGPKHRSGMPMLINHAREHIRDVDDAQAFHLELVNHLLIRDQQLRQRGIQTSAGT